MSSYELSYIEVSNQYQRILRQDYLGIFNFYSF